MTRLQYATGFMYCRQPKIGGGEGLGGMRASGGMRMRIQCGAKRLYVSLVPNSLAISVPSLSLQSHSQSCTSLIPRSLASLIPSLALVSFPDL